MRLSTGMVLFFRFPTKFSVPNRSPSSPKEALALDIELLCFVEARGRNATTTEIT